MCNRFFAGIPTFAPKTLAAAQAALASPGPAHSAHIPTMASAAASAVRVARPAAMDKLVSVMNEIAPRCLAGSWDNVGELISPSGARTFATPA